MLQQQDPQEYPENQHRAYWGVTFERFVKLSSSKIKKKEGKPNVKPWYKKKLGREKKSPKQY